MFLGPLVEMVSRKSLERESVKTFHKPVQEGVLGSSSPAQTLPNFRSCALQPPLQLFQNQRIEVQGSGRCYCIGLPGVAVLSKPEISGNTLA